MLMSRQHLTNVQILHVTLSRGRAAAKPEGLGPTSTCQATIHPPPSPCPLLRPPPLQLIPVGNSRK